VPQGYEIILDTGPLVALLNAGDAHHHWAVEQFAALKPPLRVCEAVVSETQFLLQERGGDPLIVIHSMVSGVLKLEFSASDHLNRIVQLQRSYRTLPMDFADACIICMAEGCNNPRVVTLDSHFRIYRMHHRRVIPCIAPDAT
jgi:predicted nucleic acid-binding protein